MIVLRGVVGRGAGSSPWGAAQGEVFAGEGWRFELAGDASTRLIRLDGGVLIHDGRVDEPVPAAAARNGAWLEVRWDAPEALGFCADRLGTVPVYWGVRDGQAWFSTRLVDLVGCGFGDPDPLGIMQMVMLNQATGTRTVVAGVSLMPCATSLTLRAAGAQVHDRYWAPSISDEPVDDARRWIDEGVSVIRAANRRAIETALPGKVAWPLTGGLDSRCNSGCCADLIGADDLFFHVDDMGDFELPIARKLARVYGREVREFKSEPWMRNAPETDLALDSGDFNVGHWRLAGTARTLAQDHGCRVTVDGFLQGILMNPAMFFHEGSVDHARARCFSMASFRAERFMLPREHPVFARFREDYEDSFPTQGGGLGASQQFIMENRSRRMVYGIVRLNANYLDVRTPGLDTAFIDYAMRLPWYLRKGARAYKEIIGVIDPRLAAIEHDKTGLPLSAGPGLSRRRKASKFFTYYVNRIWPGEPLIKGKETAFERLLRTDQGFRERVYQVIAASRWVGEVFGKGIVEVFERQRTSRGLSFDGIGALLTVALLERAPRS